MRSQIKLNTSQTKLHVYCKHGLRGTFFVFLDDLDNISNLLDKDNGLEEEITYFFNAVSIFIFKFQKKTQSNQGLNIFKTCTLIRVTSNDFKYVF